MAKIQDEIDALTTQIKKVKLEVLKKVSDLEATIASGGTADFTELKAVVQDFDDSNPDAATAPETAPDPATEVDTSTEEASTEV